MRKREDDQGVTLIETMIAVLIALVGVFGLGGLVFQATSVHKNQGSETTRSVVYAQDKMEKLLSLGAYSSSGTPVTPSSSATIPSFVDCTQAVTTPQPAVCNSTNITDSTWGVGLLQGGATTLPWDTAKQSWTNFSCSTIGNPGYADYLDINGVQLPQSGTPPVPTAGACNTLPMNKVAYVRTWQITDVITPGTGPAVKQITVAVYSLASVSGIGGRPIVVLTSYLESPN